MKLVTNNIPSLGKSLATYGKNDVINKLGNDVIQNAVMGILKGENIRALTETLTKRRISMSTAAMLVTYIKSLAAKPDFSRNYGNSLFKNITESKLSRVEKSFLTWMVGLTEKQIQNVLRGKDTSGIEKYISEMDAQLKQLAVTAEKEFGNIQSRVVLEKNECTLSWLEILQIFLAVGSQTLAIRGSEKSTYGKMFEKLVLGTVLTICGFDFVQRNETSKYKKIFWLSERNEKRESDATALISLGKGIRFDIGFIGAGNTEISLDKVTRFEKIIDFNNKKYDMATIIIVDRIGEKSRIVDMAKEINKCHIIQMSMSNWVKELSDILYLDFKYKTPFYGKSDGSIIRHLENNIKGIDMSAFLKNETVKAKESLRADPR